MWAVAVAGNQRTSDFLEWRRSAGVIVVGAVRVVGVDGLAGLIFAGCFIAIGFGLLLAFPFGFLVIFLSLIHISEPTRPY